MCVRVQSANLLPCIVCRLSCGRSVAVRLVRGRDVVAVGPTMRDGVNLFGLEALLDAVLSCQETLSIATCFECILFMSLPIVSLDTMSLLQCSAQVFKRAGCHLKRAF